MKQVQDDRTIGMKKHTNQPITPTTANGQPVGGVGHFMVAVGAIIELENTDQILLLRRTDNFHKNEWEVVYGRIDQGEDLETGLRREITEETGITQLNIIDCLSHWHMYRGEETPDKEIIGVTYVCRTNQPDLQISTEHSEYQWISVEEALGLVKVEGIKRNLEEYQVWRQRQQEVDQLQAKAARAMADYQNLVRRQQEDRSKLITLANENLIGDLLEPLEHLSLAAEQIKDPGLQMVIKQFWTKLIEHGLVEINPIGEQFDVETMEVVDHDDQGQVVVQVVRRGYKLGDHVVQYAKVILGKDNKIPQEKAKN